MSGRTIATTARTRSIQLAECLQSLFMLELLAPGHQCYLISPWITDFVVMNNAHGQFRALLPDRVEREVRFSMLLRALHDRGTELYILTRPDVRNQDFLAKLPTTSARLHIGQPTLLHEKSFVCQGFAVTGSMNFTFTGTHESDEQIRILTERGAVNEALLAAADRWESAP